MRRRALTPTLLWAALACSPRSTPPPQAAASPPPTVSAPSRVQAPPPDPTRARASATAGAEVACGELHCLRFPSARAALASVLDTHPLVLGLGEAHALRGVESVPSTARRFTDELLPELSPRASHLIVELLSPNPGCAETTREVREAQRPVTELQSKDNQNDYVRLGHRAKELGVEPFVLTPSCEELRAISEAGPDAIVVSLGLIAKITERMARGALHTNRKNGREGLVLAYGGALHNDQRPSPGRVDFSYGPGLERFTGGRYVELDLIVREFIKDNDVWRALPWHGKFDPSAHPQEAVLLRTSPASYVLFFPFSNASATASSPAPPAPPRGSGALAPE